MGFSQVSGDTEVITRVVISAHTDKMQLLIKEEK